MFLTLGDGEIVGLSWLAPPYRWTFDARAMARTHAIGIDARCLRAKCESDHHLGYQLMKRFLSVLVARLHATRLQTLDVYRKPESWMPLLPPIPFVPQIWRVASALREAPDTTTLDLYRSTACRFVPARPVQHALCLWRW